ncbi:MAG: hypothetical protein WA192_14235 [Candidatus Acidiferrales bacterium]
MRQQFRLAFWLLLFVMIVLPSCEEQINYPAPSISSISPNSIPAGSPQSYLTIKGNNLIQQTEAGYSFTAISTGSGGTLLATYQYISTNELVVALPAVLLQNPNTIYISVTTPQPGGGSYPPANQTAPASTVLTITPIASGTPVVTAVSPTAVLAGGGSFGLNLTGKNFVSQSTAYVNGSNRSTSYNNSTSLVVEIDSTDISAPGSLQIVVVNPPPGGGNSSPFSLTVNAPNPTLSAIAPTNAQAGGTTPTVTLTGTGFVSQYSYITMNGQSVPTAVSSGTSAVATLTAADLASAGVNQFQVVNKAPGGGTSNIITFAVNPTHLLGLPVLVDLAADGSQANEGICGGTADCQNGTLGLTSSTSGPSTSGSGQFVAFASASHNLVLTDLNPAADVYVRNTCLGVASCTPVTGVVSSDPYGQAANAASSEPSIDSSGTHAAFTSLATNLVTTVAAQAGVSQVYWRPFCLAASATPCNITPSSNYDTQMVSISADGESPGNGPSYNPVISPDGEYVAFVSRATNLVSNITPDGIVPQVYVRDTCNIETIVTTAPTDTCVPTTYLVSTPDGVTGGNGLSSNPSISEDGLYVSFTSMASNLGATAPNPNSIPQVFERGTCITTITSTTNTCTPVTTLISTPDGATPADGASGQSSLSACGSVTVTTTTTSTCITSTVYNGRFVAFASTATNLVTGVGPIQQIYVRDTCLGVTLTITPCTPTTILVSTPDGITPGNGLSEHPSVNASGQFVAFSSLASNLAASLNGVENVLVRNTCLGIIPTCTTGISLASISLGTNAPPANGTNLVPSISGDGHTVSFYSTASNLVARDNNAMEDIFLGTTTY